METTSFKGSISVREIDLHQSKDRSRFVKLLWKLYRPLAGKSSHDPHKAWVPPLRLAALDQLKPTHPFYKTAEVRAFLATKNGKPVGRVMAIHNHRYNEYHNVNVGFFGFFECANDGEVAHRLFECCEDFLRSRGATTLYGPVNPSTNYECGLLIKGFEDPPQVMMTYNPPFYVPMIEKLGFKKAKDLLAYQFDIAKGFPEVVEKVAKRAENPRNRDVKFRSVDMNVWDQEIENIKMIYNEAWEKNWGFVPMTDAEFDNLAKEMKQILDPDLAIICEVDGKAAGFILTLPDFNQVFKQIPTGKLLPRGIFKLLRPGKYINRLRTVIMGVREDYRKLGLETAFYHKSWEVAKRKGYVEAEFSWILEDNHNMNKPILRMGAVPYKTYRIYEKSLYGDIL